MSNISTIPSITYKVECGTERGTAFFIDAHRLLTAYHVVGSSLNGNPIYVEIEEVNYECEPYNSKARERYCHFNPERPDCKPSIWIVAQYADRS